MKPWMVNPQRLLVAARAHGRFLRSLSNVPLTPTEEKLLKEVDRYEAEIYRGGPKSKSKKESKR